MNTYKKAATRREQILKAACDLAEENHYSKIRRHHLVERCDTAAGNISRVMGSMDQLKAELIKYALDTKRDAIVAQAVVDKHPAISHLDISEKRRYLSAAFPLE